MTPDYNKKHHFFRDENTIIVLDQRLLPFEERYVHITTVDDMCAAIASLTLRGAPLIGIAAAYGMWLAIVNSTPQQNLTDTIDNAYTILLRSRPTAVNLKAALDRMRSTFAELLINGSSKFEIIDLLRNEADHIYHEDVASCRAIGDHMQQFIPATVDIITHCNAGELATAQFGTALSGIYRAAELGKKIHVWVDETRPWFQGARLTAWELQKHGIETTLIVDSCASYIMQKGYADLIITGADRIAANGDTANKIGTYMLSCAAQVNNIPLYIAAPSTTFDAAVLTGKDIAIEERDPDEIRRSNGTQIAQSEQRCYNPVFDVTPYSMITAIVNENGIWRPDEH